MIKRLARHRFFLLILAGYLSLAFAYSLVNPTFEAPDEIHHYRYVRSLVKDARPPRVVEGERGFGHHAPLYYVLVALPAFWTGEADLGAWGADARENPFFGYDFGRVGRDNKNIYLHAPDGAGADEPGESDTWLGLRVTRWASILMGALVVWVVYRVGLELFPDRPAISLGSAALVAFIPEFLFITAALNDDNGAALFGSLALWAMVRLVLRGPSPRRAVALGLALAAGWLAKLTMIALVPAAGLALALVAYRRRSWRDLLRYGLITFGVMLLLVSPWLVRQTIAYGDPTGTGGEFSFGGERGRPIALSDLGPDLYWLRTTFWGRLGANQIPMDGWIYRALDVLTAVAALGLMRQAVRYLRGRGWDPRTWSERVTTLVLFGATILMLGGPLVVRRFLRPMPNFGRYLFPALPAIAVPFVVGLTVWVPSRWRDRVLVGLGVGMFALGLGALLFYLAPAYAQPPVYDDVSAVDPGHRLDWTLLDGDGVPFARLLGFDVQPVAARPGQRVDVTLYWQVLKSVDENFVLFAQLFGREGVKIGQRDTYPGLGHYPTSFWRPGQVIADEVSIPVAEHAIGPSRMRLDAGLYERESGKRLVVVDSEGNPVGGATVGWLKLKSVGGFDEPTWQTAYVLGEAVALEGYDLSADRDAIDLTLHWRCLAPLPADYTVFVHLVDEDGEFLAQADSQPLAGDYPTSFWEPGERIADVHRVVLPADASFQPQDLRVGLYLLVTGERLPGVDGDGKPLLDATITIPLDGARGGDG